MKILQKSLTLFTFLFFLCMPSIGVCITIDFEGVAPPGGGEIVPATPYVEDNFTLSRINHIGGENDGIFDSDGGTNNNGTDIFGWCGYCYYEAIVFSLTSNDGSAFSIQSMDVSHLRIDDFEAGMAITVEGTVSDGGTVSQNLNIFPDVWTTHFFDSSFSNLTSLLIFSAEDYILTSFAMDNLVINEPNPVPEPSTIILFGLGILGLSAVGRKRK